MKILVLSCPTGGGHNTCAKYIVEEFLKNDIVCEFKNYLDIIGANTSNMVEKLYLDSTKGSGIVFKNIYKLGELYDKSNLISPVYIFNKIQKDKLANFIINNKYDLVICTHLFPSMALTALNREMKIPFINVATDYECIPFWDETKPDYFVIPSELLIPRFLAKGFSKEILLPFGIPIASDFLKIKEENLLPKDKDIVLIVSGSMGFGNIKNLILKLLANIKDVYFVVICGNNTELKTSLDKINNSNLLVVGFTKQMNYYIKNSTIVVTKPGGLTTTEVAVINKPLIHMMPIPGVENYNAQFFSQYEMSLTALNIGEVILNVKTLLNNKDLQQKIIINQRKIINKNGASDLVKFVINKYK